MKKVIRKYWKVVFFNLVIVGGMFSLNIRFNELEERVVDETYLVDASKVV